MKSSVGLILAAAMLLGLASVVGGMPLDPVAVEKAGGAYALSQDLFAPKPAHIDEPLPVPEMGRIGNYKALLILIKFSDLASTYSRASFDSMAFGNWSAGSIASYYSTVSYSQFTLSGETRGWYTASQTRNYYGYSAKGWGTYPHNAAKLVEEAVDAAEAAGCNFAQFDNDGDGVAESIFIVHSGEGCETSLNTNDIQSHMSTITGMGGTARNYDGVTINTYVCCPERQKSSPVTHINIGVFCHEYGHVLGLPDQYDAGRWCTARTGWGVGSWVLMGYGGWGGDVVTPSRPTHICPWGKIKLGWITPTLVSGTGTSYQLSPFESAATPSYERVLKLGSDGPGSEYFLVTFRDSSDAFDRSLRKKGLMVFHVDDDAWTENDCENGGACTSGGFHLMVGVEQPDGLYNLDCGTAGNYADRGDIYPYHAVTSFGAATTPNSNTYRGTASNAGITSIAWGNAGRTYMTLTASAGSIYDEVRYDDGLRDVCYQWGAANSGFAVRITPTKYPSLVRGLYIMSCDASNPNFQCQVWDASGSGGRPGAPLSTVRTTAGAVATAWTYVDFASEGITIPSGDMWAVYIEYNGSDIASDNSSPWSGRTVMYYQGTFYIDNGTYGNYMIRAVLDTTWCAGVEPRAPLEARASVAPNPFRDDATIFFSLSRGSNVSLAIYDVTGRQVRKFDDQAFDAGSHTLRWDGKDSSGNAARAGIYFYRFRAGGFAQTGKLSLLR